MCFIVLDFKTTGRNPIKDRITEIGAVKVDDDKVIDEFQCFIKDISNYAERKKYIKFEGFQVK